MVLVILGALALGYQGFVSAERESGHPDGLKQGTMKKGRAEAIPPVVAGIALTSGLILITSALKRTEEVRPKQAPRANQFIPS